MKINEIPEPTFHVYVGSKAYEILQKIGYDSGFPVEEGIPENGINHWKIHLKLKSTSIVHKKMLKLLDFSIIGLEDDVMKIRLDEAISPYVVKLKDDAETKENNSLTLVMENEMDYDILRTIVYVLKLKSPLLEDNYSVDYATLVTALTKLCEKEFLALDRIVHILFGAEYNEVLIRKFKKSIQKLIEEIGNKKKQKQIRFRIYAGWGPRD